MVTVSSGVAPKSTMFKPPGRNSRASEGRVVVVVVVVVEEVVVVVGGTVVGAAVVVVGAALVVEGSGVASSPLQAGRASAASTASTPTQIRATRRIVAFSSLGEAARVEARRPWAAAWGTRRRRGSVSMARRRRCPG